MRIFDLPDNQLIKLNADQLEAIAKHLEQTAIGIRNVLSSNISPLIWVSDVQHIETIFGSTESLLREVQRSLEKHRIVDSEGLPSRVGRPRRTRRRKL